jgi:hypothetical protein
MDSTVVRRDPARSVEVGETFQDFRVREAQGGQRPMQGVHQANTQVKC